MKSKMVTVKQAAQEIVRKDPTVSIYIGNEKIVPEEKSNEISRGN